MNFYIYKYIYKFSIADPVGRQSKANSKSKPSQGQTCCNFFRLCKVFHLIHWPHFPGNAFALSPLRLSVCLSLRLSVCPYSLPFWLPSCRLSGRPGKPIEWHKSVGPDNNGNARTCIYHTYVLSVFFLLYPHPYLLALYLYLASVSVS